MLLLIRIGGKSISNLLEIIDNGSPVILSVPHGGTLVPDTLAAGLRINAADLWSDWDTADLFTPLAETGVSVVATKLSRFVADVNRGPDKLRSGSFWNSRVATQTPSGEAVYDTERTPQEIDRRILFAWQPYHAALARLVHRALALHSSVILLDLHSFGMDLPADVIIGDRQGLSASSDRVTLVESLLEHEALDVKRNHRFTGGWVVQQFESEPRVDAMQLEFNQRLYLNSAEVAQQVPRPRRKEREFEVMQRKLGHVLTLLIGESGKKDPQPS